jgi:hypothetical protein
LALKAIEYVPVKHYTGRREQLGQKSHEADRQIGDSPMLKQTCQGRLGVWSRGKEELYQQIIKLHALY